MITTLLCLLLQADLAEFRQAIEDVRQAHLKGDDAAEAAAGARVFVQLGAAMKALDDAPKGKRARLEKQLKEMAAALGVGELLGDSPRYLPFLKRLAELGALDAKGREKALDASKRKIAAILETVEAPKGIESILPPAMAPAENGADVILAAAAAREKVMTGMNAELTAYLTTVRNRAEAAEHAAVAKEALAAVKPVLDELAKLGGRRARFEVDWEAGPAAQLPHIAGLLQCQKLLTAAAMAQQSLGKPDDARTTARLGLDFALAPIDDPSLISALVRTVCLSIAITTCFEVEGPDLVALRGALARIDARASFDRAWQGEACMTVISLEKIILEPMGDLPGALPIETMLREDIGVGLGLISRLRATSKMSVKDGRDVVKALDGEVESLPMLSALLVPSLSRSWEHMIKLEAQVATAKAGVALLEHHAKHGKWPETVQELDPFTGKPLLFRDGFVYSVGPDGKDDGGDEEKDVRLRVR